MVLYTTFEPSADAEGLNVIDTGLVSSIVSEPSALIMSTCEEWYWWPSSVAFCTTT